MAEFNADTLNKLLAGGQISQATFDKGMGTIGGDPNAETSPVPPPIEPDPSVIPETAPTPIATGIEQINMPESAATQPGITPAVASAGAPTALKKVSLPGDGMGQSGPAQTVAGAPQMEAPYDLAMQGTAIEAKAGMDQAAREAGYFAGAQKELKDLEDARSVSEADRAQRFADEQAKLDTKVNELANEKIDSNRFWANAGTGGSILAGISIFLGGLGGGENRALGIINNAIARDIDEQKANLSNKTTAVNAQRGLLAEMREQFKDERTAEAATRLAVLNKVDLQLKETAGKYRAPQIQGQAMKAAAAIEQERQKLRAEFAKAQQTADARRRLGLDNGNDIASLSEDERKRYVSTDGIKGIAATAEGATDIRKAAVETKNQTQMIDDLLALGRDKGRQFLPSEAAAQAAVLKNMLKGQLRTAIVGPGAMSESELKLLEKVVANPTEIGQINAQKSLEKLKLVLQRNLMNQAKVNGLKVTQFSEGAPVK